MAERHAPVAGPSAAGMTTWRKVRQGPLRAARGGHGVDPRRRRGVGGRRVRPPRSLMGPRYWQAPWYYRWLTANAGADFGFMASPPATVPARAAGSSGIVDGAPVGPAE